MSSYETLSKGFSAVESRICPSKQELEMDNLHVE